MTVSVFVVTFSLEVLWVCALLKHVVLTYYGTGGPRSKVYRNVASITLRLADFTIQ